MGVINADGLVLGRMASAVAERLIRGEKIDIVNAEKAVIVGSWKDVFSKYKKRVDMSGKGNPLKGPKYPRTSDRIVKRTVRGMLPKNSDLGSRALKRLKVYNGIPKGLSIKEAERILTAENRGLRSFVVVGSISSELGVKR